MANTIGWGKGTQNNTNGWGKFQNTIGAASVYAVSYAGETVIEGTSAAFSYSASSFHQGEADPTPTITGTTGGTFSATPSGLSINTSTGTIDLDNSTIQSYTITYTVSGVSSSQSLAVTASPFIANNFSMNFDAASSTYINIGSTISLNAELSISIWLNPDDNTDVNLLGNSSVIANFLFINASNQLQIASPDIATTFTNTTFSTGSWQHILLTRDSSNVFKAYKNGNLTDTSSADAGSFAFNQIGRYGNIDTYNFDGKLDEVAIWNTALSSDAVTEIYNATANNTGKVLDLNTDTGNYTSSANLQYWNRLGD